MNLIEISLPRAKKVQVAEGTPVGDVLQECTDVLAAEVGHLTVGLDYRLIRSAVVQPLTYRSRAGNEVYRRSLSFVLNVAASRVIPGVKLVIGHSLGGGFYFDYSGIDVLTDELLSKIENEMKNIVKADEKIEVEYYSVKAAIELFEKAGRVDKVNLLRRTYLHDIAVYGLQGFIDMPIGPLAPSTGRLSRFELVNYQPGFVLRFPKKGDISKMPPAADQTRLFAVYHESKSWSRILRVQNVGELNEISARGDFEKIVQIAEALHEKRIAKIADQIHDRIDKSRLVFIAGPSSSGKTTFAKRLMVQLRVNGLRPVAVGMDDYFVNREDTPLDSRGEYDFESIDALDTKTFNENIVGLISGKEIMAPKFDFKVGKRVGDGHPMRLEDDQVILVEGIHGLNDKLTPDLSPDKKFKIYVSALTQLTIDDLNRIPTTETRLLRRMVRDRKYRGYSAADTIKRWPSVIRGEAKNIFPFQESADVIFNTALLYELAVLKRLARKALEEVDPEEPEFNQARQLLDFLRLFIEVESDAVPPTSILREFIGGSSFNY
ncbi:MAG: nucleoside kinase [Candidatus Lindowbacteria bacterium]|nr:nucleoside kinase [Candidatus Lindowbacteria bacterium]